MTILEPQFPVDYLHNCDTGVLHWCLTTSSIAKAKRYFWLFVKLTISKCSNVRKLKWKTCSVFPWGYPPFTVQRERRQRELSWMENDVSVLRHGFNLTPNTTFLMPGGLNTNTSKASYNLSAAPAYILTEGAGKLRKKKVRTILSPMATTTAVIPLEQKVWFLDFE